MCDKCDNTNNWKFCPYCGHELHKDSSEYKPVMTQETFDEIFLDMFKKANKVCWLDYDGNKSVIPTWNFNLSDENGVWMFYIGLNMAAPVFWYSYQVYKFFNEQYGLVLSDIQLLMKHQLNRLFNGNEVTPSLHQYFRMH